MTKLFLLLIVVVSAADEIIPDVKIVAVGTDIRLSFSLSYSTFIFLSLFRGNEIYKELNHHGKWHIAGRIEAIRENDIEVTVIINKVSKSDGGFYCVINVNYSESGGECFILMVTGNTDLRFIGQNKEHVTIGIEGQRLSVLCEINSGYQVEELVIETNERIVETGAPPMITYTIVPTKEDHLTHYTCKAKVVNYPTKIETWTQLLIYYLRFSNQNERNMTIGFEGQNMSLVCVINSEYHIEALEIETDGKVVIDDYPPVINYTFIPKREDHLSQYSCKALISDLSSTSETMTQLFIYFVTFFQPHENDKTIGFEGLPLSLICGINNGHHVEKLYIETQWMIKASGSQQQINYTFVPTRKDHLSYYKCKARILNYVTTTETSIQLFIHYSPSVQVKLSTDRKGLHCLANGYPANFTYHWSHFTETGEKIVNAIGLPNGTLLFQEITNQTHPIGTYICYVSNGIRDVSGQLYQIGLRTFSEVCAVESDHYFKLSSVAAIAVFLYTIVLHIVCCKQSKKQKLVRNDSNQHYEYDDIGTINYQSATIPPLLPLRQVRHNNDAGQLVSIIALSVNSENTDDDNDGYEIYTESTSSDNTSDEEVDKTCDTVTPKNTQNSDNALREEDLHGNDIQNSETTCLGDAINGTELVVSYPLLDNDFRNFESTLCNDTSDEEVKDSDNEVHVFADNNQTSDRTQNLSHNSCSRDSIYEERQELSYHPPGNIIQNLDDPCSSNNSNEEDQDISYQSPENEQNEQEHAYIQIWEDEHNYGDPEVRYINSEATQYQNLNRTEHYVNMRVWESDC